MISKKDYKFLGLVMTFLLIASNFIGLGKLNLVKAEDIIIINEGFDGGATAPSGWTFSSGIGAYTSSGNYGLKVPSIKLSATGHSVTTAPFNLTANGKLSFWYKGQQADINSSLLVEKFDGSSWSQIQTIKPVLNDAPGTNVVLDIENTTKQIRFTYTKSAGNISLDDVKITQGQPSATVLLTSISLPENTEVTKDSSTTLTVSYDPVDTTERGVDWSSSDESVATVVDGTVRGIKAGTAVITATSKIHSNITASTTVTVREALPVGETTIADARNKASGESVAIRGIVTHINGNTLFMQDDTAGIAVTYIGTSITSFAGVAKGNEVKVTGILGDYYGLKQVKLSSAVEVLNASAQMPAPKLITIAQAKSEEYESQLVKLEGVTLGAYNSTTKFTPLSFGGDSVNVYSMPTLTNIAEGDVVNVTAILSQYSRTVTPGYQLIVRAASDVEKVLVPDIEKPIITHTPVLQGNIGANLNITAVITDNISVSNSKVYYRTKGDTSYKSLNMSFANNEYAASIPMSELRVEGLEYYIEASDGTFTVTSPASIDTPYFVAISNIDIINPVVTNVSPNDNEIIAPELLTRTIRAEYNDGNGSGIAIGGIKLDVDGNDVTSNSTISSDSISYTAANPFIDGKHTVNLEVEDNIGNRTLKTWSFTISKEDYNMYFGQLHSHTNLSDGTGTPQEAYQYAKVEAKADYVAITDHSNWFDDEKNTANEAITSISQSASAEWKLLNQTADANTEDGKFVGIAGFEMSWSGSTGGWGHINTFNTPWFASRSNSNMNLKAYYDKLAESKNSASISQLNHPGNTFGDFSDFGFYSVGADNVVNLIEVGNGEGAVRSSGYFPSYEYYTRALDKGWHLAPTNNQDNHKGKWVNANAARTVILAKELTRDSLYEAMRNRRVYATEDENLEISYTVNGKPMGTILSDASTLDAKIRIVDPDFSDKISKVSIIVNGGAVAASKTFDSNTAEWDFTLPEGSSYYYVRVDEADKDIAVTAPVWAGKVIPVGISKVDVSQNPQIVNTPVDITATVYNNGAANLSNVKVEFFKGSIAKENKIGENTITSVTAAGTTDTKISWTPTTIGELKLYAQATINIDGIDNKFIQTTSIEVSNAEDLVKVVLDGGHQNQYVSGDYKGKMLTLASMLKDKKFMLVQNNDELTADDLKNAKVLIITDPQSKDDAKNGLYKSNFTDAEIEVIKNFIASGGNLIITSRADYNDKDVTEKSYESSSQGNRILEAIGSNLRFNDDEVVDNTSNGGQAFRLYFDNYTGSKYGLTDNIVAGYTYSAYSGCSVILKQSGNDSEVDWLVKGHDTTEILDSDLQNDAIPVEKGKVNSLASEKLTNGSKIVVAGTTFFSDFETASSDNAYSNKQITDNVLNWMSEAAPSEIKTIAEVRADADKNGEPDNLGKKFTIEGIVTSQSEAVTPKNAFFEVIYVQDETGGITVFGVSKTELKLGQKVRITGKVDSYLGDAEIQIADETKDVKLLDSSINLKSPKLMTTLESMKDYNEGWLVKVQGVVRSISGNNIFVDDGTGTARAYVEGYINDGSGDSSKDGKWDASIKIGNTVSVIGLASEDTEGHRLRVRNTNEIVKVNVTIDTVPPVITIDGIIDGAKYVNSSVKPEISVNEEAVLTVTLDGNIYDGKAITKVGTHKLIVEAVDKAGNKSVKEVSFTIETAVLDDPEKTAEAIKKLILDSKPDENVIVNASVNPVIYAKLFEALKGIDRQVSFTVETQGMEIIWTFNGKDIKDTDKTIDLTLNAAAPNKAIIEKIDADAMIISFKNHGELPAPMTVSIPVDTARFDITKPLYFYYYNETTKKAELVGDKLMAYKKGDKYYVDVVLTHNSDFFLSSNDNTIVSTKVDKIAQLGSPIDTNVLYAIGIVFLGLGVLVMRRRNRREE